VKKTKSRTKCCVRRRPDRTITTCWDSDESWGETADCCHCGKTIHLSDLDSVWDLCVYQYFRCGECCHVYADGVGEWDDKSHPCMPLAGDSLLGLLRSFQCFPAYPESDGLFYCDRLKCKDGSSVLGIHIRVPDPFDYGDLTAEGHWTATFLRTFAGATRADLRRRRERLGPQHYPFRGRL